MPMLGAQRGGGRRVLARAGMQSSSSPVRSRAMPPALACGGPAGADVTSNTHVGIRVSGFRTTSFDPRITFRAIKMHGRDLLRRFLVDEAPTHIATRMTNRHLIIDENAWLAFCDRFFLTIDSRRSRRFCALSTSLLEPKISVVERWPLQEGVCVMLRDGSFEGSGEWSTNDGDDAERIARVHRKLKRIAGARAKLDAAEAAALRDAQALRIWRPYGYASLIQYMERELGYTPRAAIERLRVANAIKELPLIAEAMSTGDLPFSAAREITRVATPETEGAWIAATEDKNVRQVEELVSGHKEGDKPSDPPDPKLVRTWMGYRVTPEIRALERQVRLALEKERGERLDDVAFLEALYRRVLDGGQAGERTRAPYQVAVTTCAECKRGWQHGGGVTALMSPPALERALCDSEVISLDDPTHRAKQAIPPATRRKVHARDHGKCRVPDCRSARNLDLHHIVHRENGGTNDMDNLITLSEGHHLAHHEGSLLITGTASSPTFERSPNSKYKIETRVVETKKALRQLGWKPEEVVAAMNATRAHVGNRDLTLEQWIKIALSKCPKPT